MIGTKTHLLLSMIILATLIFYINEMVSIGWMMLIVIVTCLSQLAVLVRQDANRNGGKE